MTMTRSASLGCAALVAMVLVAQTAHGADPSGTAQAASDNEASAPPAPAPSAAPASSPNNAVGWTLVGTAGAMAVGAGLFGAMALQAQSDFQHTSLERSAADASDRYARDTAAFATCVTLAVTAAIASAYLLLRPRGDATAAQVRLAHLGLAVVF